VLELSKQIMYSYLYQVLKPTFGSRLAVLYSDTGIPVIFLYITYIHSDCRFSSHQHQVTRYSYGNGENIGHLMQQIDFIQIQGLYIFH